MFFIFLHKTNHKHKLNVAKRCSILTMAEKYYSQVWMYSTRLTMAATSRSIELCFSFLLFLLHCVLHNCNPSTETLTRQSVISPIYRNDKPRN